ncbi:hypothetical protein JTE90_000475 [Oedothorax gibbosus]|uniref:Uncharacterized protein n=1 Tax=Oedothorax gibbosus TaxID=931172 RepID=A0AAV6TY20_9ARAC|nr:hypothetical protein JTE90_000475 [Oedothorax gibbosus]
MSEKRSGEICNACVLLVKRWKKLPIGTNRDWHHVVDARAGPGTKCMTRNKPRQERKPTKKLRLRLCRAKHNSTEMLSDDIVGNEEESEDESSTPSPRHPSPTPSNSSSDSTLLEEEDRPARRRLMRKRRPTACNKKSSFLDMTFWREERICCGVIFRGPHGEALINPKLLHPCHCRRNAPNYPSNDTATHVA